MQKPSTGTPPSRAAATTLGLAHPVFLVDVRRFEAARDFDGFLDERSAAFFDGAVCGSLCSAAILFRRASIKFTTFDGFGASSFGAGLFAALALIISSR